MRASSSASSCFLLASSSMALASSSFCLCSFRLAASSAWNTFHTSSFFLNSARSALIELYLASACSRASVCSRRSAGITSFSVLSLFSASSTARWAVMRSFTDLSSTFFSVMRRSSSMRAAFSRSTFALSSASAPTDFLLICRLWMSFTSFFSSLRVIVVLACLRSSSRIWPSMASTLANFKSVRMAFSLLTRALNLSLLASRREVISVRSAISRLRSAIRVFIAWRAASSSPLFPPRSFIMRSVSALAFLAFSLSARISAMMASH
mmetsp:Transcript_33742/g.73613  ORF Transcript_33742/g.73613 Transcript_33742/m.73613 type:complete len:266 (+) Transcript_33742:370-1167(+)